MSYKLVQVVDNQHVMKDNEKLPSDIAQNRVPVITFDDLVSCPRCGMPQAEFISSDGGSCDACGAEIEATTSEDESD